MDWKWLAEHAQAERQTVTDAPIAFAIAVVFVATCLYRAFKWVYQSVFAHKDAAISGQQITITNQQNAITDLRSEVAELRDKLVQQVQNSHQPASPLDPDAIYQLGVTVGQVVGAQVDRGQGLAVFSEILGGQNFNPDADFRYRELILHVQKVNIRRKSIMTGQRSIQLTGVVCQIVGQEP